MESAMQTLADITVRLVEENDLEAMQRMISANGYPISISDMHYRYELYKKSELNRGWLAMDNLTKEVVGYVALIANKGIRSTKLSARVINLFVAPEYRRHGIGKKLLTIVEEYIASLGQTELKLIMPQFDQDVAENFYSQLGYTPSPERDAYITNIKHSDEIEI